MSMTSTLIIADIAGQMNALQRLVDKVPASMDIVLLGDLIDRGPHSFDVVEWAMKNEGRVITLMGNHEHMMLDFFRNTFEPKSNPFRIYGPASWLKNGGLSTLDSYMKKTGKNVPPTEHLDWLLGIPLMWQLPGAICTHAPIHRLSSIEQACSLVHSEDWKELNHSVIWNRSEPRAREEGFQVFGHNSCDGLRWFEDYEAEEAGNFAVCLDQSAKGILTGMIWPEREILEVPYYELK